MGQRGGDWRVVLVQGSNKPVVHARHRDLAAVQYIDNMPARFAAVVNLERVAVRFVLHDDPARSHRAVRPTKSATVPRCLPRD